MKNATWKPLFWEPVEGTDERLMAGALVDYEGEINAYRILRDDILECVYGKAAGNPKKLLDTALQMIAAAARASSVSEVCSSIMGLHPGETRNTEVTSVTDALRQAALMYSSLANLDKLDDTEAEDAPSQEESNKRFITEVRDIIISRNPILSIYFNKATRFFNDGEQVKFGFLSDRAVIHYGVLHPVRQSSSVKDARARLFELARIRDITGVKETALILAVPNTNDATLGTKQREAARRNAFEIQREAASVDITLSQVNTAEEAATKTEDLAL